MLIVCYFCIIISTFVCGCKLSSVNERKSEDSDLYFSGQPLNVWITNYYPIVSAIKGEEKKEVGELFIISRAIKISPSIIMVIRLFQNGHIESITQYRHGKLYGPYLSFGITDEIYQIDVQGNYHSVSNISLPDLATLKAQYDKILILQQGCQGQTKRAARVRPGNWKLAGGQGHLETCPKLRNVAGRRGN